MNGLRRCRVARRRLMLWGCLALLGVGCAPVAPYQRENLAKPSMDHRQEAEPAAFRAHVHDSREGATGGQSSTGGGCGCN